MFKKLLRFLFRLLTTTCPNCESAWTGGHPNPQDLEWCVLCSSPRTGRMRHRVWRWLIFSNLTTNANMRIYKISKIITKQNIDTNKAGAW